MQSQDDFPVMMVLHLTWSPHNTICFADHRFPVDQSAQFVLPCPRVLRLLAFFHAVLLHWFPTNSHQRYLAREKPFRFALVLILARDDFFLRFCSDTELEGSKQDCPEKSQHFFRHFCAKSSASECAIQICGDIARESMSNS